MFLIFNYFVRLWCAIQEFQQKVCSECPMELIALPNNNLVCNLWSELKQLQVCIYIASDDFQGYRIQLLQSSGGSVPACDIHLFSVQALFWA